MEHEPPLDDHRSPMWLPWIAGPEEQADGPALVSLSEFKMHTLRDLPGIAWTGMRLRAGWYGLPGAVGLHLWMDLTQRSIGSLSVWTNAADLRRWIGLPLHTQVMRRYRSRGIARATQWTCEPFDRAAILVEAKRRLTSARGR